MIRFALTFGLCLTLPLAAQSEGLLNKLKKGASDAGQAIDNTASDVGSAIGNTVDSTAEMVTNEDTPEATRARIDEVAQSALDQLLSQNADAARLYDISFGYAVFDARQLTVAGAAAGYGRGVAVAKESAARTYMQMGTGGVGVSFGLGGFDQKIIILFQDQSRFDDFVWNGFDATAQAGVMAGDDKGETAVGFADGRSAFHLTKKGWKVSSSLTGTKYWRDSKLN